MDNLKKDFPIYQNNPDLVYLDTAASSLTPAVVVEAMDRYYEEYRSNIHRGLYPLASLATEQYELARATVANFINAQDKEVVFTSGTTNGLNLLAFSLGQTLRAGDNVVLTRLEHHANLIPWQQAAKRFGFEIKFVELKTDTTINFDSAKKVIDKNTRIVSFAGISNALGTVAPTKELLALTKSVNAISIIDAAQVVGHRPIDVKALDCDFLVFSGHKMYGPTGIGVLYGKEEHLKNLEPFQFGGEMIGEVTYQDVTWATPPAKFEAGTPNIAGAIGLAKTCEYLSDFGWDNIQSHEEKLLEYLLPKLLAVGVGVVGLALPENRAGVVSFNIPGVHPHDVAEVLGKNSICVRAGHHCAMPLMNYLGINGTARLSLGIYNNQEDLDKFLVGIEEVKKIFKL